LNRQFLFLLCSAILSGNTLLQAQSVKVFSRYDYYMRGDPPSILGVLPDSMTAEGYRLVVLHGGRIIGQGERAPGRILTATLDLSSFPVGTTLLNWQLLKGDRVDTSGTVAIVSLSPKANAVQIDRLTGGLIADRMPFFPFGFYCTSPVGDLPEREVVHGFNLIPDPCHGGVRQLAVAAWQPDPQPEFREDSQSGAADRFQHYAYKPAKSGYGGYRFR